MQLTGLILENFKSFAERTVIPLAPITLLFGENSAGKSSIIQSLLMLMQTAQHAEPGRPLLLARGDLVDLGSIQEMLYAHDSEKECEISVLFPNKYEDVGDSFAPYYRSEGYGIGVRFGCRPGSEFGELEIRQLPVYWGETALPITILKQSDRQKVEEQRRAAKVWSDWRHHEDQGERFYAPDGIETDHPVLRMLYQGFRERWHGVAQVLREWPELDSIQSWQWSHPEWESQPPEDREEDCAEGYLSAVIERFNRHGRDLVAELLAQFDQYSFEQYVAGIEARSQDQFRICGFGIIHPGQPGGREALWYTVEQGQSAAPELPSLDGVLAGLYLMMDDGDRGLPGGPDAWSVEDWDEPHIPNPCAMAADAQEVLDILMSDMRYVGPLRERPARQYTHSGLRWPAVGKSGTNLPEILLADEKALADLNEALRVMQAEYQVEAVQPRDSGAPGLFWLRLADGRTGIPVSPLDVGFGVGQMLPVITQMIVSSNKLLLFEQPELHLHPRLQAELGSLLAKTIADPYGNQVIVETHSEYLVYRLQKLIRLGHLKPSDVSVVYVSKDEDGSHCVRLRLDEDGDFLDPWPGGFFDTGFDEIFGIK